MHNSHMNNTNWLKIMVTDAQVAAMVAYSPNGNKALVRLFVPRNGHIWELTHDVAMLFGEEREFQSYGEGVVFKGTGTCPALHIIHRLSHALYGESNRIDYRRF